MLKTANKGEYLRRADCRHCGIRNLVLFADLNERDLDLIHEPIEELVYGPGASLYSIGSRLDHVFTIRSGWIKLLQYQPGGSHRIVRLLSTGEVAGLEVWLNKKTQHHAVALEEAQVCRLPLATLSRLFEHTPRLQHQLMRRWQQALDSADSWITQLSSGNARARVARFLLFMSSKHNGRPFRLFSCEDIGAVLGITTETASRILAEYKRIGLVLETGNHIVQVERAGLEPIAGFG